jgi:Ca2+-binding RTX toxin-like protein
MTTFVGTTTNENIIGSNTIDSLTGAGGDDTIKGLAGDDHIDGDYAAGSGGGAANGDEFLVNTTTTGAQGTPHFARLAGGGAVAIWSSAASTSDYAQGVIMAQILDAAGQPVGGEFQVSPPGQQTADHSFDIIHFTRPEAMQLANGNILMVWSDATNGQYEVYGRLYDSTGTALPGGPILLTDEPVGAWQVHGTLAPDANGGFRLTYQSAYQSGDGGYGQFMRAFDANGVPTGASVNVNTYTTWDQGNGEPTRLTDGGHVVVWISLHQDESDPPAEGHVASNVYLQRYDAAGAPVGGETLVHPGYTTDVQGRPDVTALADGGYVVTWHSWGNDGDSFGIFSRRYDAAGNAGAEVQVNETTAMSQRLPRVAALDDGGYVIAWQSLGQDGDQTGIYYRVYEADGTAGAEMQASVTTAGRQMIPSVTSLDGGGFMIGWSSADGQDGDSAGIYARYFGADGNPVSNEGNDKLRGGAGNDVINGNGGDDKLWGQAGQDQLSGGSDDDVLRGGGGSDTVQGDMGLDILRGNAGADMLDGGAGDDLLRGDGGADNLTGGMGQDSLWGGAGGDSFIFASAAETGLGVLADTITGFNSGSDKIDLSGIDADTSTTADDPFQAALLANFTGNAGELRFAGGFLSADVDGDMVTDFEISLAGFPALLVSDIVL